MLRLFITLVFCSTVFLPTDAAFPVQMRRYQWPTTAKDRFYLGILTLPDGTRLQFRSKSQELYFPRGSQVTITPYRGNPPTAGRTLTASAQDDAGPDDLTAVEEEEIPAAPKRYGTPQDEADALDYETGDIVGRVNNTSDDSGSSGGASAQDLCDRIETGVGFRLGTEKLKASGGISTFNGEAAIMGTRLDWQCGVSDELTWGAFISRHFFSLKQKKTSPDITTEDSEQYDRIEGQMHFMSPLNGTWQGGLGISYHMAPTLRINDQDNNASRLRSRGFGMLTLKGAYIKATEQLEGFRAYLDLHVLSLGKGDALGGDLTGAYRFKWLKQAYWELGINMNQQRLSSPNDCQDNPRCKKKARSDITTMTGSIGIGKEF